MSKLLRLAIVLALSVSSLIAQSAEISSLGGTWILDKDYVESRGSQTWTITVDGNSVKIEKVYHVDNTRRDVLLVVGQTGVKQPPPSGAAEGKVYWKDKQLIREYTRKTDSRQNHPLQQGHSTAQIIETYYLSTYGTKLIFRRDDDSIWPNRNTPVQMGRPFEDKIILRRKI